MAVCFVSLFFSQADKRINVNLNLELEQGIGILVVCGIGHPSTQRPCASVFRNHTKILMILFVRDGNEMSSKPMKMNEFDGYDDYAFAEILPEHVLENIFSYLNLRDLRNCALVCKSWYRILSDENNDVWRLHCVKRLVEEVMKADLLSTLTTYKAKLRAFYHAWNPHDCSRNIYIKPNGFTLHRNPVAQSTDACRGKIGFYQGRHAWEVIWEGPLGTVAVVGVSTRDAPLQCQGYVGLLGSDEQSWGWNLVDNQLLHNGDTQGHYPLLNNCPKYQVGERIRVILDCEDNTLSFERNYEFLGVAFRGLPNKRLYPTVSAVYGNTEVSMVYLGPPVDG